MDWLLRLKSSRIPYNAELSWRNVRPEERRKVGVKRSSQMPYN